MTALTSTVMVIQLVSLGFAALLSREFLRIVRRRTDLLCALGGKHPSAVDRYRSPMLWVYWSFTLGILVISSTLFIIQPHLL